MTEGQPVDEPKKFTRRGGRRGLLAFYVATGVALALVVGGGLAWTPLRIAYFEHKVRSCSGPVVKMAHGPLSCMPERCKAAESLIRMGPVTRPALARLLQEPDPMLRGDIILACSQTQDWWWMPLVIQAVEAETKDEDFLLKIMLVTGGLTGKSIIAQRTGESLGQAHRRELLDWWESEGKAKYGRGE